MWKPLFPGPEWKIFSGGQVINGLSFLLLHAKQIKYSGARRACRRYRLDDFVTVEL